MPLNMENVKPWGLAATAALFMGGVAVGSLAGVGDPPRVTGADCAAANTVGDVLALERTPGGPGKCAALHLGEIAFRDPGGLDGNSYHASDKTGRIQVRVSGGLRPTRDPKADFVCQKTDLSLIDGGYWLAHCQLSGASPTPTPTGQAVTAAPTPRPAPTARPSAMEPAYYNVRQIAQPKFETDHAGETVPINGVTLRRSNDPDNWLVDGIPGLYVKRGGLPRPGDSGAPSTITCGAGSTVQMPKVPGYTPTIANCVR